jgi:predicted amidohydrolase YtcJ
MCRTHAALAAASLWLFSTLAGASDISMHVLSNGVVLTMDKSDQVAQAVAISGERIVGVGSNAEIETLAGPDAHVIDVGGRTIIPGLVDTHVHAIRGGQTFRFETYWYDATTLIGALENLKATAAERGAGKWVTVAGAWSPDQFEEKRGPTVEDLNTALPNNPAYVQYLYDYALLNEKGLEALGLIKEGASIPGIEIERDAEGKPTGKLFGDVGSFSFIFNKIGTLEDDERKESLAAYLNVLNSRGVTGLVDAAGGGSGSAVYDPLFSLWRDNRLILRVSYRVSAQVPGNEAAWFANTVAYLPAHFGDSMLQFLGLGEILVFKMNDGVRLRPGFSGSEDGKEELYRVAMLAAHRKYPLEIHTYTNDAAKQILDVFERVAQSVDLHGLRWCIAHITTGTADTFERMSKLGLCYSQMNAYYEAFQIARTNGLAVAEQAPPTRLALNAGLMVVGGTDSTRVGEFNTWRAIEYQVTGRAVGRSVQRRPDLGVTREEALRFYTANAAWLTFDENRKGTLEAGKLADIAVLDQPYLTIPADQIHTLKSLLTMVGGKIVYAADPFQAVKQKWDHR